MSESWDKEPRAGAVPFGAQTLGAMSMLLLHMPYLVYPVPQHRDGVGGEPPHGSPPSPGALLGFAGTRHKHTHLTGCFTADWGEDPGY